MVGFDVSEDSLVVCDDHDAHFGSYQLVHAFGDDFDGIYVQSGVCFVQNGYFRL